MDAETRLKMRLVNQSVLMTTRDVGTPVTGGPVL